MLRAALALTAAALAAAPAAAADILGAAQVRTADGALVAAARGGSFAYPRDRFLVSIGSVSVSRDRVELRSVRMLNGSVAADRVTLARGRSAVVDGLVVDGLLREARQNSLFSVDSRSYLVVEQKAVIGKTTGLVALRLVVAPGYPGLPNGAQVLVGLRQRGSSRLEQVRRVVAEPGPWAVLGFGGVPSAAGFPVSEPLLGGFAPVANGLGGRAVAVAEQFLGVPYRWGGASPATGFDCSGLTKFVYAQLGITLTHFAAAQAHEGMPVPPALLEPGDLVFFDPGVVGPGHVGIYIGGGAFIHAPHTGDVVKISTLAQYARRYDGAVRPYSRAA
jgi:cell wall-associated NlpC family hydrolase